MGLRIVLLVLLGLIFETSFAQHKKISVGLTPGLIYYQGDLSGSPFPAAKTSHFSMGLDIGYKFSSFFETSLGYTFGKISGDDALVSGHESRNLRFHSNISDIRLYTYTDILAIVRKIWPSKLVKKQDWTRTFSGPHVILGLGYMRFNPKAEDANGRVYELQKLGTEGQFIEGGGYPTPYSRWQFNVKYGLGMGYFLSRQLHLELQFVYNQVFTDYLDDVSGEYPDYNELMASENGDITSYFTYGGRDGSTIDKGTLRGNASKKDGYIIIGIKVAYTFSGDELKRWLNF